MSGRRGKARHGRRPAEVPRYTQADAKRREEAVRPRGESAGVDGRNYVLSLVARISFVTLAAPLSYGIQSPGIRRRRGVEGAVNL